MQTLFPIWLVEYRKRRPRIGAPLTRSDYGSVEVQAKDREAAAHAFRQRFPIECEPVAISMRSATGWP